MSSHRPPAHWSNLLSTLLSQRPELVGVGVTEVSALVVMCA